MKEAKDDGKYSECVDFDRAVALTGYGRFHCELLTASALCILSAGFQNGLSGYVFPAAKCDLRLTSGDVGALNAAFLVGGACGSFVWGMMADTGGRKRALVASMAADVLVTAAFAVTVTGRSGLMVCRCLNGFMAGAPGSVTFSYLAEFHPPKNRSKAVCYSGMFFTAAFLLLPVTAYSALGMNLDLTIGNFRLNNWRFLFILLVVPEIIATLWLLRLPESPSFLIARGDVDSALEVLKQMYSVNYNRRKSEYPVKQLIYNVEKVKSTDGVCCEGRVHHEMKAVVGQIRSLFCKPLLYVTLLMCAIMFTNMFGFFGLGLWLPELFIKFKNFHLEHPNLTISLSHLSIAGLPAASDCDQTFDWNIFTNTAAVGVSCLAGNFLSGLLAGRLHLKTLPCVAMMLAGVASLSIYFLNSSLQVLVVSCLFMSSIATGNLTLGSVAIELYPTSVSAMALCLMLLAGRVAAICSNVIFGLFFDKYCEVPVFVVAGVAMTGCCLCLVIPKSGFNRAHNETDIRMDDRNNPKV